MNFTLFNNLRSMFIFSPLIRLILPTFLVVSCVTHTMMSLCHLNGVDYGARFQWCLFLMVFLSVTVILGSSRSALIPWEIFQCNSESRKHFHLLHQSSMSRVLT